MPGACYSDIDSSEHIFIKHAYVAHHQVNGVELTSLGFVDGGQSTDWVAECGGRVINLLAKGSLKHCTQQLKKTPEEHIADIRHELDYASKKGISVNLYLEDWSNGMKDSPEYVYQLMDALTKPSGHGGVVRFMLPDTLGVMNPLQVIEYFRKMMKRYPGVHFDFHAHNDYVACHRQWIG